MPAKFLQTPSQEKEVRKALGVDRITSKTVREYGFDSPKELYEAIYEQIVEFKEQERKEKKREAQRRRREAQKAEKQRRAMEDANVKLHKVLDDTEVSMQQGQQFYPTMKNLVVQSKVDVTKPFKVSWLRDGAHQRTEEYRFSSLSEMKRLFRRGESGLYFDWYDPSAGMSIFDMVGRTNDTRDVIVIYTSEDITPERLEQRFADGPEHCLLYPIKLYFENLMANAKTDKSKANYASNIKTLDKLIIKYKDGIPENCIQTEVCNKLRIDVIILDVVGNEIAKYRSPTQTQKIFKFSNTREDHVEHYTAGFNTQELDQEEMTKKYEELCALKKFMIVRGNLNNKLPTYIETCEGRYRLDDENTRLTKDFMNAIRFNDIALNEYEEKELVEFLRLGRRMSSHVFFGKRNERIYGHGGMCENEDEEFDFSQWEGQEIKEMDMKGAYTKYEQCSYYRGFLRKIHQVRDVSDVDNVIQFISEHVGMYMVRFDVIVGNSNTKAILNTLGIRTGVVTILPSPELEFLWNHGCMFTLIKGVWGFAGALVPDVNEDDKTIDYTTEIGHDVYDNKELRNTCFGKLDMSRETKNTCFTGTKRFAQHLASILGAENVRYWAKTKTIEIIQENKNNMVAPHVLGFITSYTRINVLEQLFKFDYENIIGIKLDSIVFVGENKIDSELWTQKRAKCHFNWGFDWYRNYDDLTFDFINAKYDDRFDGNTFLAGAGGCGKTHTILSDKGFYKPLYVAPMWRLATEKAKEYGVECTSIHQLTGLAQDGEEAGCRKYRDMYGIPSVILIDEATMIDASVLNQVKYIYPESLVFIAGDIDKDGLAYQCTMKDTKIWKPTYTIVEFTTDYRSKCDTLRATKLKLRELMKQNEKSEAFAFNNGMKAWLKQSFKDKLIASKDVVDDYKAGDVIICSRNKVKNDWTDKLKHKDERWVVKRHNSVEVLKRKNGEESYLNGEIYDHEVPNSELRLGFTIHSYQGMTVKNPTTLYIDLTDYIFDRAQIYTAISRAETMDQIKFIV